VRAITSDVIERAQGGTHVGRTNLTEERVMSYQSRNNIPAPSDLYTSTGSPRQTLRQRLAITWAVWRERTEMRRRLAEMDARSLRDAGISPAAAAYESGKPFWERVGCLR
jgi:uncharacterized protein YjiS (DUF1127 family)